MLSQNKLPHGNQGLLIYSGQHSQWDCSVCDIMHADLQYYSLDYMITEPGKIIAGQHQLQKL